MSRIRGIQEGLLDMLLELGKSHHPREFLAVLRERNGILNELDLIPGTINREQSASFSPVMIPLDTHIAGSAHSHPNGVTDPSPADLRLFPSMGKVHLIIGSPYTRSDWKCYTAGGAPRALEVIP